MDGSALRGDAGHEPGWAEVRRAVMTAAEDCAAAVTGLCLRGADRAAVRAAEQAVTELRDMGGCLRPLAFDEAVIEAEADRRTGDALAAAGLAPAPARHLHVVS